MNYMKSFRSGLKAFKLVIALYSYLLVIKLVTT